MLIEIKRITTNEYPEKKYIYTHLLNDLEEELNIGFNDKDYGESIVKYYFGFELYKFDGQFAGFFSKNIESWKTKTRSVITNVQFDWNVLIKLNDLDILNVILNEFGNSIGRIENMKRKPKDFNFRLFQTDFKEITRKYSWRQNVG